MESGRSVMERVEVLIKSWHVSFVRIEDIEQTINKMKPYLLAIVKTPPSTKPVRKEIERHITYLSSTITERHHNREQAMPGTYYFTEETVEELLETMSHVITAATTKYSFVNFDYIISVLFPEMIIKLIINRENCTYEQATLLAYNQRQKEQQKPCQTKQEQKSYAESSQERKSKRKGNPRKIRKQ